MRGWVLKEERCPTNGGKGRKQGSKNRPSPVRLNQVVSASTMTVTSAILDTYTRPWINWTRMIRLIFRVNPVNSEKNQQILDKRAPSQQESIFQRNQRFLCKRKPMKIWNKPVTLSKAFKKSLGWRITYLTLNPPLSECRIFVFGAVPSGKVADRGPIVWEAANRCLRGVLGKNIARLHSTDRSSWSSWCWGRRQRARVSTFKPAANN